MKIAVIGGAGAMGSVVGGKFAQSGNNVTLIDVSREGVRFYHYGDTAIFSDLPLIGELYRPTIGCLGIANPVEILDQVTGPGRLLTAEMSPREGVLAAEWLGLDTVLPCHYINPDADDVREFERLLEEARAAGKRVPASRVIQAGGSITVQAKEET